MITLTNAYITVIMAAVAAIMFGGFIIFIKKQK